MIVDSHAACVYYARDHRMVAGVFGKGHAKALTSWKGSIASARIKPVASKLNEANELEILGEIHRQGGCLGKEIQKPKRKNFIHLHPHLVKNL